MKIVLIIVAVVVVVGLALGLGLGLGLRKSPAPSSSGHAKAVEAPNPTLRATIAAETKAAFATKPPRDFPIDAVVTWVDGKDDGWRARVAAALKQEKQAFPSVMHGTAREPLRPPPNGHDELYFNMHLAAAHMPWLRTYYVVCERPQKPVWWPANGKIGSVRVELVHHDQIVAPPMRTIPTYNSAAIQTWLHNIPGLSEHFVLFDDDFFVGQPLARSDFFSTSGKPVTHMHVLNIGAIPSVVAHQSLWNRICMNTRRMAFQAVNDKRPMLVPPHVCVPIRKSLYGAMLTRWFPHESGAFKRFRSPETDFTPHYLHLAICALLGYVKPQRSKLTSWFHFGGHFGPALRAAHGVLPHFFCINDSISDGERKALDKVVDALFP